MADTCPSCTRRDVPPAVTRTRSGRIVHGYRCPDCGHQWVTARLLAAYPDTRRSAA